ncbi:MAG: LPP20 family lipoprotein [Endozoicomonadaceae bacterium]|nr:LPP20 family lipoprotein [Endozoicomonadaceae bacterium]
MGKMNILAVMFCLGISGCATKNSDMKSDFGIAGAPDWVNEGTRAVSNKDGRFIRGLGIAPKMDDFSLQKSMADSRARAEVAKVLIVYVDQVIDDFSRANASSGEEVSSDIQFKKEVKQLSQTGLQGVKIIAYWRDTESGRLYAFAEMDKKNIDESLSITKKLNLAYKTYLNSHADNTFDKLAGDNK